MVCGPGATYVGPSTPPVYALPGDVCSGPSGLTGLGPPEPTAGPGPVTGTGNGIVGPEADAGPYSAPPFDLCPTCPTGWTPDSAGSVCCRTIASDVEQCFSPAYYLPSASVTTLDCSGPADDSSCACSEGYGGHAYTMSCAAAAGGEADCTCAEDGVTTTTFTTSSAVLDPLSDASSAEFGASGGCGFPL